MLRRCNRERVAISLIVKSRGPTGALGSPSSRKRLVPRPRWAGLVVWNTFSRAFRGAAFFVSYAGAQVYRRTSQALTRTQLYLWGGTRQLTGWPHV